LWAFGAGLLAGATIAGPAFCQSAAQPAAQQNQDSATAGTSQPKDAKSSTPAKKVYTNDDLRSTDSGGVSVVGNNRAAAKPGKATTADTGPKNEQYWRSRAQKLRNEMAEVDRQIAELEAANQDPHTGSSGTNPPPPPPSAYTVGAHVRGGSSTPLQRLENRKAQLQREMDQLEEEARKAGVPPGWLR
jgi:hypothetical protein